MKMNVQMAAKPTSGYPITFRGYGGGSYFSSMRFVRARFYFNIAPGRRENVLGFRPFSVKTDQ